MKINKETLCTLAQISYHFIFLGGSVTLGEKYLQEFRRTKEEIVRQVDKANKMVDKVKNAGDTISNTGERLNSQLKKVEKACRF
tara:strand:- start:207 stop:458 length:252 start_codon:yes stop_codon:yes gene_type:complete